ncbi:hypothetical protein ACHAPJ_012752 [Fusarium lateritium]
MTSTEPKLTLFTYFRSSCAARVRTAASIKGIPLDFKYINLLAGDQKDTSYTAELNPSATVPTLEVVFPNGDRHLIRQSMAILEFFEEAYPQKTPLLPPTNQPLQRAIVRDLVNILCVDIQPKTNLSVIKRLENFGVVSKEWNQEQMLPGLLAYEAIISKTAGEYSLGDDLTLADVVLCPAIEAALRWGVDLTKCPLTMRVYDNLKELPEVAAADWRHQLDTPENLRA